MDAKIDVLSSAPHRPSRDRPLVYAHRGGAALRPENTIDAFDHGLSVGADGLELDVHLSRDGVVVVHHDETLERTTDARGPIAAFTADELARVDAGYWFRGARMATFPFRGRGISVPTLRTVLRRYRDARLIIELKMNDPELARADIDEVRAADAVSRVALGSFGWRVLRRRANDRAADSDRRRARGNAVGTLPLLGWLAARTDRLPGVSGSRAIGQDRRSCRRAS